MLLWCGALLAARIVYSHSLSSTFVVWLVNRDRLRATKRMRFGVPLRFDVALLLSCAATGILLAFTSVADVQDVIAARYGKGIAWTFDMAVLVLCWNSWDLATEPLAPAHARRELIYGISLAIGYAAFRVTRVLGVGSGNST